MYMARFFQPCHELGLTPTTRAILKAKEKKENEEFFKDAIPRHEQKEKKYE